MRDMKRGLLFFLQSLVKSGVGHIFLKFLYQAELDARTHAPTHSHTHNGRVISTSQQPLRTQHAHTHTHTHTHTQETNIHALSGIRNLDPSNRVDADYTYTARPLYIRFQTRSQKCENLLLTSSCLSFLLHGATRLPTGRFTLNLMFDQFSKICQEDANSLKI